MTWEIRRNTQQSDLTKFPFAVTRTGSANPDESIALFRHKFDAELFLISTSMLRKLLEHLDGDGNK